MSESLRDTVTAAVEQHTETPAEQAPAQEGVDTPVQKTETHAEPAQQEPKGVGRTAGRARDEHGRLLPGKADPAAKVAQQPQAQAQTQATPKIQRPSSWKKDHWDAFDQLASQNPALAEYINQRESEYAKGVSTYKQEWDRAKPLLDAIAPHQQMFQQYGIDPSQQISKYIEIHKFLAMGTPEQKLGVLLRIAQDYQIPVQQLFVQGQDGKLYFSPQVQPTQSAQQQQGQDPRSIVRDILAEEKAVQELAAMEADTQKYPHYATVKATMARLLASGEAQDLQGAYTKAIRLHDDIWQAEQENTRKADEQAKADAERKRVAAAKAARVSVRSDTPTEHVTSGKTGLRAQIAENVDAVLRGRV